ncbi:hypothetical protein T06_13029 [Trichinella sp. T6]|nr:hypothetical protein T06_13029 [Trichinella sp. T6]
MSQFRKNVSYLNSSGRQSGDKGNAAADILPDTDEAAVLLPILSHIACLYLCICVIHKNIGFKLHWVSHPELVKSVESTATNSVARHENIIYASDFQSVGRDPLVDHQRILCGARKHADVVGTGISANADGELIDLSEDSSIKNVALYMFEIEFSAMIGIKSKFRISYIIQNLASKMTYELTST